MTRVRVDRRDRRPVRLAAALVFVAIAAPDGRAQHAESGPASRPLGVSGVGEVDADAALRARLARLLPSGKLAVGVPGVVVPTRLSGLEGFAFDRDGRAFVYAAEGKLVRREANGEERDLLRIDGRLRFPDVCERDGRVAFAYASRAAVDGWRVGTVDADGGRFVEVAPGYDPAWAPSGTHLAYEVFEKDKVDVVVHDLTTGRVARPPPSSARRHTPNWSPDGATLVYSDDGRLVEWNVFTDAVRLLTREGRYDRFAAFDDFGTTCVFFRQDGDRRSFVFLDRTTLLERTLDLEGDLPAFVPAPPTADPGRLRRFEERSAELLRTSSEAELSNLDATVEPDLLRELDRVADDLPPLFLHGVERLDPIDAASLSLRARSRRFVAPDLRELDAATARAWLLNDRPTWLRLDGLRTISPEVARLLGSWRGSLLTLNGLTDLDPTTARELARFKAPLRLNGLRTSTPETATALATWRGNGERYFLGLDGLKPTPEIARILASGRGWGLSLGSVTELDDAFLRATTGFNGACLRLLGVRSIDAATADRAVALKWSVKFLDVGNAIVEPKARATLEGAGTVVLSRAP
jgi:dipeptidyl aminopeptidase/acylaminoacyl peptidase